VVLHAKAHGLQAIDMVQINYNDAELLQRESKEGFEMGYTGKQIIHPNQIGPVQKSFSPSEKTLQWATRVIAEFKRNDAEGRGAFALDGKMIDMPTVKQAEKLVARGKACGLL